MQRIDQPPNVHTLLTALADRLVARRANHAMSEPLALAQALIVAEHAHGPTEAAETAEHALVAALPPIRPKDTRAEYAARLRLIAEGAVA
ncbi:hypothetical protein OG393_21060 [Streptomyces sp. NBC_01216]|uniref:hypothetical protein n=1 Tax=Streptomyces sp. NBC_01216 TaxID=2903778 RepID=UPI002E124590|nr:hypothetical protein OG393_21060 [Streptomyces sp. NBC_01216]